MAKKSNNTALAIALQASAGALASFSVPADYMPISNLRPQVDGVTIANDEYTGSVVKNGDVVAGKKVMLSFNVKLRPPGGADVPAANAYLLGRVLQAAKFSEVRTTAAIPVAAEAVAGGTETEVELGAGAAATADLYKGMAIQLADLGATFKAQLTALRSYAADKTGALVETLGDVPAGNYQLPKQLSYMRSISSTDPTLLSIKAWIGGDRWDVMDCRVTSLRISVPVSTRDQAAYPEVEVTVEGTIAATAAEDAPAVPSLGAIPLFKDGDQWLALTQVGGSNFAVDLGIQAENPPNPNQPSGSDSPEIVASTASLTMTRQKYAKDVFDTDAMADAQAQHPFFAQWGNGLSGGMVQVVVPDARFNYQNPDLGGGLVMESGTLFIDALDRGVVINFPYGAALA